MKKKAINHWILIIILSFAIAILNIIRVIMGAFQTPNGQVYLAIGHFYMDYLEYTQQIAQGIFGHTLVQNQFTTNDPTQTLIGWGQYLLIGYIARLFHASQFLAYWVAIFVLSVCVLLIIFLLIRKILHDQPFFYQLIAFLFSIFAVPFVTVIRNQQGVTLTPIDFFYAPISLFHRIGGVPHHITTTLFVCVGILLTASIIKHGIEMNWRWFYSKICILIVLCVVLLTFAPLQVFILLSAIGVVTLGYALWFWHKRKKSAHSIPFLLFIFLLSITIVPAAIIIKYMHGSQELFLRAIAWETAQLYHPTPIQLMETIGPILLLVPFGIRTYFKSITPLKLLLLTFVIFSYVYFSTNFAYYFGTFNQRFLTPVSYVFFGITAVLGLQTITRRIPFRKILSAGISTLYLLYFITITLIILRSFGGSDVLGYMPKDFFTGIRVLNNQNDTKAVLTSPYNILGLLVPNVIDRNVYLGRIIFTPDYEIKQQTSYQFYAGSMNASDSYQLLKENNIGYILVSSQEPFPKENMMKYPFISELYQNSFLTILQFQE